MIRAVVAAQWLGTRSSVCPGVYTDTSKIQAAALSCVDPVPTIVQPGLKRRTGFVLVVSLSDSMTRFSVV